MACILTPLDARSGIQTWLAWLALLVHTVAGGVRKNHIDTTNPSSSQPPSLGCYGVSNLPSFPDLDLGKKMQLMTAQHQSCAKHGTGIDTQQDNWQHFAGPLPGSGRDIWSDERNPQAATP
ncbi:hypothetical protein GE21DRAFT_1076479 [Neurospora crassa]|nr:hypothetical protein GE21DRAFT_1076479 [Neurospora crassa]